MTVKILIQGHSFVARLKRFIRNSGGRFTYSMNLPPREYMVQYSGIPGGKVSSLWNDDQVQDFEPDIVILQCGSNDLCNDLCSPRSVKDNLLRYAEHLINNCNVKRVVIMQILHRLEPKRQVRYRVNIEWYNNRVDATNHLISDAILQNPVVDFHKHRGLCEFNTLSQAMTYDGTHLNDSGYIKYFRNIRAALKFAHNRLH